MKHAKMDDAGQLMEIAKADLKSFQKELRDVDVPLDLRMEVGSFLTFADSFFDGFVVNYLVQSKISDAKEQVSDVIFKTEQIISRLKKGNIKQIGVIGRPNFL